ncbi:MAG: nucleoid-associated protein [Puia sp.]|nr:nucleoid-associated protein [Puia sp.]
MDFSNATLNRLAVHYVGNKNNQQPLLLSKKEQSPDKEYLEKFSQILLGKFSNCFERYSFHHTSSLDYNEVYNFSAAIFGEPETFLEQSSQIASHLYEVSLHPKIKPGELYVTHFGDIMVGDRTVEGIGLFKAETKSLFVELDPSDTGLDVYMKEGLEPSRIDKGCLVLNTDREKGFELIIFDNASKGDEAQYWKDKFLGVLVNQNEFLHTHGFLTLTKNYVTKHLPDQFEVTKTDQIDLLNRSMDYFKSHDHFDKAEFEETVLHHEGIIDSFRKFDEQYRQNNAIGAADQFEISPQAVKKQSKVFKSVIKLDRNFHIYVHGDRDLIERGFDEAQKKYFYKIWFDVEK